MIYAKITNTGILPTDTILGADWEIATDLQFTTIVVSSINDTANLTSILFNNTTDKEITYYGRVRLRTQNGYGLWSNLDTLIIDDYFNETFITDLPGQLATPLITTNCDVSAHPNSFFTISVDNYRSYSNASLYAVSYLITDIDNILVWSNTYNDEKITSVDVNDIILKPNTVYLIKAIFHTSSNDFSNTATMVIKTGISDSYINTIYPSVVPVDVDILVEVDRTTEITNLSVEVKYVDMTTVSTVWSNTIDITAMIKTITIPANTLSADKQYYVCWKTNIDEIYNVIPINT